MVWLTVPRCPQRVIFNVYYSEDNTTTKSVQSILVKYYIDIYLAKGTFGRPFQTWNWTWKVGELVWKTKGLFSEEKLHVCGQCLAEGLRWPKAKSCSVLWWVWNIGISLFFCFLRRSFTHFKISCLPKLLCVTFLP